MLLRWVSAFIFIMTCMALAYSLRWPHTTQGKRLLARAAEPVARTQLLPRLYLDQLEPGQTHITLRDENVHYLTNIMRQRSGSHLRVFNERCGEYLAELQLTGARSKNAVLTIKDLLRNADNERRVILPCTLLVAPIKKTRMKVLLEKATELGVGNIIPVVTQNTQHQTENLDQFRSTLIQSAEQCERLSIPVIQDLIGLGKLLEGYKPSVVKTDSGVGEGGNVHELLVCAERLDAVHRTHGQTTGPRGVAKPLLTEVLRILSTPRISGAASTSTFSILIGPEGGFTEKELDQLAAHPAVTLVSLGPSILRAETAALYALSTVSCAVQANRARDTAAEAYLK